MYRVDFEYIIQDGTGEHGYSWEYFETAADALAMAKDEIQWEFTTWVCAWDTEGNVIFEDRDL